MQPPEGVTQLLIDWSNGDEKALAKLMPLVYSELRRLASNYLRRERQNHTLQLTSGRGRSWPYRPTRSNDRSEYRGRYPKGDAQIAYEYAETAGNIWLMELK